MNIADALAAVRGEIPWPGWDAVIDVLPDDVVDAQWWDEGLTDWQDEILRAQWRAQVALECQHIVHGPERLPVVFRWEPGCWVVAYDGGYWDDPTAQPTFTTHADAMAFVDAYVTHPSWLIRRDTKEEAAA